MSCRKWLHFPHPARCLAGLGCQQEFIITQKGRTSINSSSICMSKTRSFEEITIHVPEMVVFVQLLSCPTLCNPMDCSTPGFLILYHLSEFAQIHIHWVGDAYWPSHPLSPTSPPAFNLSQHQSFPMNWFFASGGQRIGASPSISVLPMNFQGSFLLGLTGLISL